MSIYIRFLPIKVLMGFPLAFATIPARIRPLPRLSTTRASTLQPCAAPQQSLYSYADHLLAKFDPMFVADYPCGGEIKCFGWINAVFEQAICKLPQQYLRLHNGFKTPAADKTTTRV